jgi:3-dehydroquinate dehydratase/shikimate dehydrogenase
MTKLCVPITATTVKRMRDDVRCAAAAGADMVELRLDFLDELDGDAIIRELLTDRPLSVIVTCRIPEEGGHYDGDESNRISLFEKVGLAGPDFIDVELAAWQKSANIRQKIGLVADVNADSTRPRHRLILSSHDFDKTPAELDAAYKAMTDTPCHVAKLVGKANSLHDNLRMFDALRTAKATKPAIGLCMGEQGLLSRVLARKFGAELTFASLAAGTESASGQLTVEQMLNLYRWKTIDEDTQVYGVVGHPLGHSMSPAIHNASFEATGINAVYLPLLIDPAYEAFAEFFDGCRSRPWFGLGGASVTIPHKLNALKYVGEIIEPLAQRIGAVNTLILEGDTVRGINTDYVGALDALTGAMGCDRSDLHGSRVAVLGAGGASRAIVAGLVDSGCAVTIYNRTIDKAAALAQTFDAEVAQWSDRQTMDAEIVVNTTSVGMHPNENDSPLPVDAIRPGMVIFDTVYNPIDTQMLRDAKQAGCQTVDGVAMFVNQAVAQFEAWTHEKAPVDTMQRIVLEHLGT